MAQPLKPGEGHDRRGVPIYPGDLLKSFHFTGPRRKKYWLYHVAVLRDGYLEMVPTSELEPTLRNRGGCCWLLPEMAEEIEVIAGHGPGDCLDFDDRPKQNT